MSKEWLSIPRDLKPNTSKLKQRWLAMLFRTEACIREPEGLKMEMGFQSPVFYQIPKPNTCAGDPKPDAEALWGRRSPLRFFPRDNDHPWIFRILRMQAILIASRSTGWSWRQAWARSINEAGAEAQFQEFQRVNTTAQFQEFRRLNAEAQYSWTRNSGRRLLMLMTYFFNNNAIGFCHFEDVNLYTCNACIIFTWESKYFF